MLKLIGISLAVLALWTGSASALTLKWDAVTTDPTGAPLVVGSEVSSYKVYKCNTPAASCTKAQSTLFTTVSAPAVQLVIDGQPVPASYIVSAVNIVGESVESGTVKVTPPDRPKNERLQ